MASRAKVRGGEKQQQSLSLGRETVEELEKEAERRGLNKSQLADLLLNGQLTQSADKPTIISIMSYKGGVAKNNYEHLPRGLPFGARLQGSGH